MFVQVYINNVPQTVPYEIADATWQGLSLTNLREREKYFDEILDILASFLPEWNRCGVNREKQLIYVNSKGFPVNRELTNKKP